MVFFFFNDTATTEIYTLSLHDALPISVDPVVDRLPGVVGVQHPLEQDRQVGVLADERQPVPGGRGRSEEHTSELQSRQYLVCRLLLEKKTSIRDRRSVLEPPTTDPGPV